MTDLNSMGRRSVLKTLFGLGVVTVGASMLMGAGAAEAAEVPAPAAEPMPETVDINELAPDESRPETAETQYYVVRRRVYPRRRVVVVRRPVRRRRVVVVRRRVYPRRRVVVVRRRRY